MEHLFSCLRKRLLSNAFRFVIVTIELAEIEMVKNLDNSRTISRRFQIDYCRKNEKKQQKRNEIKWKNTRHRPN